MITTQLSSASTPISGAGCHPLSDWLAQQPNEVRGAHSYRFQIDKIVESYRDGIRLMPPAGIVPPEPLTQGEIDEVNDVLSDIGINDQV